MASNTTQHIKFNIIKNIMETDISDAEKLKHIYYTVYENTKDVNFLHKGEKYWYHENGDVKEAIWNEDPQLDKLRLWHGNVFTTDFDCENEVNRLRIVGALIMNGGRRYFNVDRNNYIIVFDNIVKQITVRQVDQIQRPGDIYFSTENAARNAITKVGRERIIQYMFSPRMYGYNV